MTTEKTPGGAPAGEPGAAPDLPAGLGGDARRPALAEIGVCAIVAVICVIFLVQAWRLPPGTFEPLGSGPVPMVTASIVLLCCAIVMLRAARHMAANGGLGAAARDEFTGRSPAPALVVLGATVLYVAALDARLASFGLISFVYLTLLIWTLERFRPRKLIWAALTGAIFAFGVQYLFTEVFVVDLPA